MKKKNCQISHTNYEIINKENKVLSHRTARDFNSINELIKSCDIGLSSVIAKKKYLKENVFLQI
mgnify:CR=1 FL=1